MGISLQLPEGSPWRTILRVCLILLAEAAVIAMLKAGIDDVRSWGKTGSHGQMVKMTRMTHPGKWS